MRTREFRSEKYHSCNCEHSCQLKYSNLNEKLPYVIPMSNNADRPFDSTADADIILRSSNKVDFFVLKSFLCIVSSVFDRKFSVEERKAQERVSEKGGLPVIPLKRTGTLRLASSVIDKVLSPNSRKAKESNDENSSLPIIVLEEDSTTLYNLLLLIYPYSKEPPRTVEVYLKVGDAARKYAMDEVEGKLMKAARDMDALTKEPFRVFAIASHFGWVEVMKDAARNTLKIPLRDLGRYDELRLLNGVQYHDLLQWQLNCREAVETLFAKWDTSTSPPTYWMRLLGMKREAMCCPRITTETGVVSRLLAEYARKTYPDIVKSRAWAEAEIDEALSMVR